MRAKELIEQVTSAHRSQDGEGRVRAHEAWHDLSRDERIAAHEATVQQRRMEAALDPEGLSTTARAVLAKILG